MSFNFREEEPSDLYHYQITLGHGLSFAIQPIELEHLMSEYYLQYGQRDSENSSSHISPCVETSTSKQYCGKSFWLDSINGRVDHKRDHVDIILQNMKVSVMHAEFELERLFFNEGKKILTSPVMELDDHTETERSQLQPVSSFQTSACSSKMNTSQCNVLKKQDCDMNEKGSSEVMDEDEDSASLIDTDSEEESRSDSNGKDGKPSGSKEKNSLDDSSSSKSSKKHSDSSESEGNSSKQVNPKRKKRRSSKSKEKEAEPDSYECWMLMKLELRRVERSGSDWKTMMNKNLKCGKRQGIGNVVEEVSSVTRREGRKPKKAKVSMKSIRDRKTKAEKDRERKLNSERRRVLRTNKRFLKSYSVDGKLDVGQHNFNCYMKSLVWKEM
ncbi:Halomucin [Frankliniella fusca]|uniref:Halomucin n=1 Tax=Frankliniella fusca TaxID=407009 RepID=A0AAE1HKK1_9NEOP|nr:Halomucin [Frankliniella fusca]